MAEGAGASISSGGTPKNAKVLNEQTPK